MNEELRSRLRQLALEATPGPWAVFDFDGDQILVIPEGVGPRRRRGFHVANCTGPNRDQDAAYMAAVSPDVLLALLDEIEDQ